VAAAGGLGQPILAGFATYNTAFLIEGVLLVAVLALLVDRVLTPPVSAPRCDRVQQSPRTRDTAPRPHPHPKGLARRDVGESDSVIAGWPISTAVDQIRRLTPRLPTEQVERAPQRSLPSSQAPA